ncbi:hypothetical protein [Sutcliffiella halmapala]|uniref:hypothetical protein n=1 Tax=Sutcliffiella halmapala TaxID=79882 RepID=UPI000995C007|nr:hypothetical protein [Sutcliffiella halmapala]
MLFAKKALVACVAKAFLIGFVVLSLIKRIVESKKSTTQFTIWWIVGTTAWGITTIMLLVWWFNKT